MENNVLSVFYGLLIPFLGTVLGASCVVFLKTAINNKVQKLLLGFASGVMVAASVWSLIIPSIDMSDSFGKLSFIPAAVGIAFGFLFLLFLDKLIPHLHATSDTPEGRPSNFQKTTMLVLAVTLHNIPEGMAVGVVWAGMLFGGSDISFTAALALSIGIAIQNFPEGAVISLPLKTAGKSRFKAFLYGAASGVVEPIAAVVTILLADILIPVLPWMLSFAAGAMLYVVVEELIPEASEGSHSNIGTIGFAIGFIIMLVLDVSLG